MSMDQVLNDAKYLEKSYRAVLAIVAKMEEIGDLDKAYEAAEKKLREHKQAVASAENKMQEAKDRLDGVYEEVAIAKDRAASHVADGEAQVKTMLADASHEVAEMNNKAKEMVETAEGEANRYRAHVNADHEAHKANMQKCGDEYTEAVASLAIVNDELAALRKRIG